METVNIENWIDRIVNGPGGFVDFEHHEMPRFPQGRDIALVEFVIRALANPDCAGAGDVLAKIEAARLAREGVG